MEGVNALQPEIRSFYDTALYLDASEENLFSWYAARLSKIREEVREDPTAYLHRLALLSDDEFRARIETVWRIPTWPTCERTSPDPALR